MKSLAIKIGKIWGVFRQDGLAAGSRRLFSAARSLLRPVGSGDVLLISGGAGVGASALYRTRHVAEELRFHGFSAEAISQDNPVLMRTADRFKVFVFHRAVVDSRLRRFIASLKERGHVILFETDDLTFDPEFLPHMDYFRKMNPLERKLYEQGLGVEILNDPDIRHATTTTTYLSEILKKRGKEVFIVKNKLSEADAKWAEELLKRPKEDDGHVRLCYLSGTPSHDKDFATIVPPLRRLLETHSEARLVLAGPLDVGEAFSGLEERIDRVPFTDRKEYFRTVSRMDINLAPLEIGNPFCESKSELKFFEAGLLSVPTVAAATQSFREAISDGIDGMTAATGDEWEEKLGRLLQDAGLRRSLGERARETALSTYTTRNGRSPEYYAFLSSVLNRKS